MGRRREADGFAVWGCVIGVLGLAAVALWALAALVWIATHTCGILARC